MPQLPTNFVSNMINNSTELIASLSDVIGIIVSVLLTGAVLALLINAIKR